MAGGQRGSRGVRAARLADGESKLEHETAFLHLFMEAEIVLAETRTCGHAIYDDAQVDCSSDYE